MEIEEKLLEKRKEIEQTAEYLANIEITKKWIAYGFALGLKAEEIVLPSENCTA